MIDFFLYLFNTFFMTTEEVNNYYVTATDEEQSSLSKKQLLLDAGLELFAKKGLNGTTIRDIAQLSKVNSSMISYHYNNKQGLYRACLENIGTTQLKFLSEILSPVENKEDYINKLNILATRLIEVFTENKYSGMLLIKEFDLVNSPAGDIFNSIFSDTFDTLNLFFKSAKAKKVISEDKDEFTLTSFCIGLLFSQLRLDYIKHKIYNKSLINQTQRELFLKQFISSLS